MELPLLFVKTNSDCSARLPSIERKTALTISLCVRKAFKNAFRKKSHFTTPSHFS